MNIFRSDRRSPRPFQRGFPGFTLIEMLVVIGIIAALIAVLAPMALKAMRSASRTRMAADLSVIAQALDAYKGDFGSYPTFDYAHASIPPNDKFLNSQTEPNRGAVLLCWALMGFGDHNQDGADGPGFRTRGTRGQVYGPYLQVDRFQFTQNTNPGSPTERTYPNSVILDRKGHVIDYIPAYPQANITIDGGYIGTWKPTDPIANRPMYNMDEANITGNDPSSGDPRTRDGFARSRSDPVARQRFEAMLGDRDFSGGIGGGETAAYTGPYLLWSAGPDELYGPAYNGSDGATLVRQVPACDDVTNFNFLH